MQNIYNYQSWANSSLNAASTYGNSAYNNPFSLPPFPQWQLQEPETKSSKIGKLKTKITVGDILWASLTQLLPPATHHPVYGLTPDILPYFRDTPDAFDILSCNLDLSEKKQPPRTADTSAGPTMTSVSQTKSWHFLPAEVRNKIYLHYFSSSTYTIHDPATCTCPDCPSQASKNIFWIDPKSLSTTTHSNQSNLFLTSPEIIHEAHPIWLAESTFRLGACILRDPSRLHKIKTPISRFLSIKKLEVTATDFNDTIAALKVFKQRLGLGDVTAPSFKLVFRGNKLQFRLLWNRMMKPKRIVFGGLATEPEIRETGLEGVRIEFTRDW